MSEKLANHSSVEVADQFSSTLDAQSDQASVPYDENLMERARAQWQFGDWESLSNKLDRDTLQHHPDRAKLALLAAAGRLQNGRNLEAKEFIRLARDWGVSKRLISQILIAGVHNSLGRAVAVGNRTQPQRAIKHFESAIRVGASGSDAKLFTRARITEQLNQLGLPSFLENHLEVSTGKSEVRTLAKSVLPAWIQKALEYAPDAPPLLIAAAESAQRDGDWDNAIRYWQRLAAVDGVFMQNAYYDRLAEAYRQIRSFPAGMPEEEFLRGDTDKHLVLKKIHQVLSPKSYLEIGVQTGRSLFLATCQAIGVDPMPMVSAPIPSHVRLVHATSDQFFAEYAPRIVTPPIDLVFIDGMHLFEYVLRDFTNVERISGPSTLVVIDDVFPGHPAQAARDRRTRAWTGDVWKLLFALRQYRSDLSLLLLDAHPTGLLCISGLDPNNRILENAYEKIVTDWSVDAFVPDEVIARSGALPCSTPELEELLVRLKGARKEDP